MSGTWINATTGKQPNKYDDNDAFTPEFSGFLNRKFPVTEQLSNSDKPSVSEYVKEHSPYCWSFTVKRSGFILMNIAGEKFLIGKNREIPLQEMQPFQRPGMMQYLTGMDLKQ